MVPGPCGEGRMLSDAMSATVGSGEMLSDGSASTFLPVVVVVVPTVEFLWAFLTASSQHRRHDHS